MASEHSAIDLLTKRAKELRTIIIGDRFTEGDLEMYLLAYRKNLSSGDFSSVLEWTDDEGRTVLHLAAIQNTPEKFECLVRYGASEESRDIYKKKPSEYQKGVSVEEVDLDQVSLAMHTLEESKEHLEWSEVTKRAEQAVDGYRASVTTTTSSHASTSQEVSVASAFAAAVAAERSDSTGVRGK